jgi:hypothetical protein
MPDPTPDPERVALVAFVRLVQSRHGGQARLVRLSYEVLHPLGLRESVTLSDIPAVCPPDDRTPAPPDRQDTGPGGELRKRIVEELRQAGRPLKGSVLAMRLDKVGSSYLRTILAALVSAGVLVKVAGGGYWLASLGPPPA